jgi:superfamily I DNA/RNA helicase
LLVIAGAGTGKTMTLAHLIIQGVSPDRILLLTFTRRAAQEMTRRVETIVRQALGGSVCPQVAQGVLPWSGTFHSVGNRLIAESERQYKKNLFSKKQGGGKPSYITVEDGDAEAKYVVEAILANREEGMQLKTRRYCSVVRITATGWNSNWSAAIFHT